MFPFKIILFILFIPHIIWSQQKGIRVGLYRASQINEVSIEFDQNSKFEISPGIFIWGKTNHSIFRLKVNGNKISVFQNNIFLGSSSKVKCLSTKENYILLKPVKPDYKGNKYQGEIELSVESGHLKMINHLDLDTYLIGVLRGEVGYDKPMALYQVHAILSRTYAQFYPWRHKSEGFNVCDQTHCQVYKGWFDYKPFSDAVKSTESIIVKDSVSGEVAELLFHSNCGGMTNASEDVWKSTLTYCRNIKDTFCLQGKNAVWVKQISMESFCKKMNIDLPKDSILKSDLCISICSNSESRIHTIQFQERKYKMIDLRSKFDLKSAWFDWECRGDSVLFYGRGFGHGVGLCQEGAIRMAELGYTPEQIIKYYFKGVILATLIETDKSNYK